MLIQKIIKRHYLQKIIFTESACCKTTKTVNACDHHQKPAKHRFGDKVSRQEAYVLNFKIKQRALLGI